MIEGQKNKHSHNVYLMKDLNTKYGRVLLTLNNTMLNKVIFKRQWAKTLVDTTKEDVLMTNEHRKKHKI